MPTSRPVDSSPAWGPGSATSPSHPALLDYLAQQLMTHDYDGKHVARLILNSQTYQRRTANPQQDADHRAEQAEWFAAATRRRLTAEQIFDSLFAIAAKPVQAERLTMDPEGRRPIKSFLNLGTPERAWQFSSLSNERDRPALSLPVAQSANDLLKAATKDKEISEDDEKRGLKDVQDLTDAFVAKIDELYANKEAEILEV